MARERHVIINQSVFDALSAAAHAKGSPLGDAERAAVLSTFPEELAVTPTVQIFTVKLADLLDPQTGNAGLLAHVNEKDSNMVADLASRPANPLDPIRVRKNLRVADGFHRLAAAQRRGDAVVFCTPATLQEELSA
jgi:hypothetical protein